MQTDNELMDAYTVVFDRLASLGPGEPGITENIAERLRPDLPAEPRVADFGCGVGASALVLARCLPGAHILAVDSHAPFVARLATAASAAGLEEHISAVAGDMADPPPLDGVQGRFDLIWSESAIYSIGRSRAFACWRPLLNPGGWLVFSDVVWQRTPAARTGKASTFWTSEYPDITTADEVVNELAAAGFSCRDPVLADRKAWSNYYEPLRERLHQLAKNGNHSKALVGLIAELERELDVYDCAGDDVALYFFPARLDSTAE